MQIFSSEQLDGQKFRSRTPCQYAQEQTQVDRHKKKDASALTNNKSCKCAKQSSNSEQSRKQTRMTFRHTAWRIPSGTRNEPQHFTQLGRFFPRHAEGVGCRGVFGAKIIDPLGCSESELSDVCYYNTEPRKGVVCRTDMGLYFRTGCDLWPGLEMRWGFIRKGQRPMNHCCCLLGISYTK